MPNFFFLLCQKMPCSCSAKQVNNDIKVRIPETTRSFKMTEEKSNETYILTSNNDESKMQHQQEPKIQQRPKKELYLPVQTTELNTIPKGSHALQKQTLRSETARDIDRERKRELDLQPKVLQKKELEVRDASKKKSELKGFLEGADRIKRELYH